MVLAHVPLAIFPGWKQQVSHVCHGLAHEGASERVLDVAQVCDKGQQHDDRDGQEAGQGVECQPGFDAGSKVVVSAFCGVFWGLAIYGYWGLGGLGLVLSVSYSVSCFLVKLASLAPLLPLDLCFSWLICVGWCVYLISLELVFVLLLMFYIQFLFSFSFTLGLRSKKPSGALSKCDLQVPCLYTLTSHPQVSLTMLPSSSLPSLAIMPGW